MTALSITNNNKDLDSGQELMTTKQVAKQLNCAVNTVRENAKKCLPNKVFTNGKVTYWTEAEVTILLEYMKENTGVGAGVHLSNDLTGISTSLTPALRIKKAMLEMQSAYEDELANLRAKNIEVVEENGQLRLQVSQLNHALEYDKVSGWKVWNQLKKEIKYKGNFQKLVDSIPLSKNVDYAKKVMGYDNYPTTLISPDGEEKIIDYKECILDEE